MKAKHLLKKINCKKLTDGAAGMRIVIRVKYILLAGYALWHYVSHNPSD